MAQELMITLFIIATTKVSECGDDDDVDDGHMDDDDDDDDHAEDDDDKSYFTKAHGFRCHFL